jgi:hypothetical protein
MQWQREERIKYEVLSLSRNLTLFYPAVIESYCFTESCCSINSQNPEKFAEPQVVGVLQELGAFSKYVLLSTIMSLDNHELYEHISGTRSWEINPDKNSFLIHVAAIVLHKCAAESLGLAYDDARTIVSTLVVEEDVYRHRIDQAYKNKNFEELAQLRGSLLFFVLVISSISPVRDQFWTRRRTGTVTSEHVFTLKKVRTISCLG